MGYVLWKIDDIAQIVDSWQNNKFDGLIVFDGNRGLGKSTGALQLAYKFDNFKMRRDVVFSRKDVMRKLAKGKHAIIIADEMINVTYNRDFYSEDQKKLLKMLNMYRDSCNVLIACVPNFYDLDKQFRNMVKMRINVVRRGLAVIHTKNQSSYAADKWDLSVNEKIERKWMEKKVFKPNYSRLTTYRGMIRYPKLRKLIELSYEKIKEEKRNKVFIDVQDEKNEDIYDRIIEFISDGRLNKEQFDKYCAVQKLKPNTVSMAVNRRLKEAGKSTKFHELFKKGQAVLQSQGLVPELKVKMPVL